VTEQLRMLDHKVVNAVLSQPVVYGATLTDARLKRDFVVYDWAPDDQSSIGAMALSRKSFSADQARQWDALMVTLQRDGTLLKLSRKYLGVLASQDLIYTGKRLLD
jgi:ABC-type amino acid transport substrate-binding protein